MNNPNLPEHMIRKELSLKEEEAKDLLQWLQDHPDSSIEETEEVRNQLNGNLQAINDLVYKLNPGKIYIIR